MKLILLVTIAVAALGCNPRDAGNISRDAGNLAKSTAQAAGSAQLAARVNSILVQRKGIDMSGLHIEAQDGVVTVGGHVRDAEEKRRVLDTVDGVRGVEKVVDKLRIEPK
jgi:osmotically-inducible protein OsmY